MNLTGSIKDRMALHIIRRAYAEGRLHPGDTIAEATSAATLASPLPPWDGRWGTP